MMTTGIPGIFRNRGHSIKSYAGEDFEKLRLVS